MRGDLVLKLKWSVTLHKIDHEGLQVGPMDIMFAKTSQIQWIWQATHTNLFLHRTFDDTALQEAVNFLLKIKYEDQTIFFFTNENVKRDL